MLKLLTLASFTFLLFSCNNSTVQDKNSDKQASPLNSNSSKFNPVTIEYSNEINGYKVTAVWLLQNATENEASGPAILSFTNSKTNEVYYATHHNYSVAINKDNLKYLKFEGSGATEKFVGNESFKQTIKYVLPEVQSTEFIKEKGLKAYIPFFFKDVDFNKDEELILVDNHFFEKGGYSNQVYKLEEGYEMTTAPFNNFRNFYMNTDMEGAAYNLTTIDYNTKTITQSYITGAATGGEDIYKYNAAYGNVELFSKSVTDWDDNAGGGTITTVTDKNGKVIKSTKSGK